ncbi:quinone oxidoreductase family protein [Furfurilactobacillus curtus]|uniref:Alcohol dehydrogenase n=1 Tax=Furfurilactobacillus curtus TaxID=1746200 RepID=A0ABQ5JR09_9LACO
MKAAVLNAYGQVPQYQDFPAPTPQNDNEILVRPKAASIKQLDIIKAAGKHYTNFDPLPAVMGMDGVAQLNDDVLVYANGVTGMMAEQAIIDKRTMLPLPDGLDIAVAASIPNTLSGSDGALTIQGKIKSGDVVLVNGATGATGTMAVQMAKYRGASFVIATGRNEATLAELRQHGADATINLQQDDELVKADLKQIYAQSPIDLVVDYLWGRPAELILSTFGELQLSVPVRYVSIGQMAGATITLPSQLLRSRNVTLVGSGIGSIPAPILHDYLQKTLPEIFDYAAAGHLYLQPKVASLNQVAQVWSKGQSVLEM